MSPTLTADGPISPTVSAIVPVHNGWDVAHRAIGSALLQRDVAMQVLVVDDGSAIPAPAHITRMLRGRGEVIRHPVAQGVAAARNAGIRAADGDWLAFLDHDDYWAPGKLAAQLEALAARPGCAWGYTSTIEVDRRLRPVGMHRQPVETFPEVLGAWNAVPGGASTVVASSALVRELGGFDTELSHVADWDMWIRLASHSDPAPAQDVLAAYVLSGGSMSNAADGLWREVATLAAKHAHERRFTVRPDTVMIQNWLADRQRSAGRRLTPAGTYAGQAWRLRSPRIAGRAVSTLVWPTRVWHRRRAVWGHLPLDPAIRTWLWSAWTPATDPDNGRPAAP